MPPSASGRPRPTARCGSGWPTRGRASPSTSGRPSSSASPGEATVGERTVELTAREFALAETFLRHPDQVLSRQQLLSHVWGYDFDPESNIVDVYVRYRVVTGGYS